MSGEFKAPAGLGQGPGGQAIPGVGQGGSAQQQAMPQRPAAAPGQGPKKDDGGQEGQDDALS